MPPERPLLLVTNEFPPRAGGAGMFALRMSHLQGVEVVSPKCANAWLAQGRSFLAKLLWLPELLLRLLSARRKLVRSNILLNDFGAMLAFALILPPRSARVTYLHHGLISAGSGRNQALKTWILQRLLSVMPVRQIAVSRYMMRRLNDEGFNVIDHLHVGVDAHMTATRNLPARKLAIPPDDVIRVGVFGRINAHKVPRQAIDFLAGMSAAFERAVSLNLHGAADDSHIQALIDEAGRHPGLHVLYRGMVSGAGLAEAIADVDMVVNFSDLPEACPTISMECAALGQRYVCLGGYGHDELAGYHAGAYLESGEWGFGAGVKAAEILKRRDESDWMVFNHDVPRIDSQKKVIDGIAEHRGHELPPDSQPCAS